MAVPVLLIALVGGCSTVHGSNDRGAAARPATSSASATATRTDASHQSTASARSARTRATVTGASHRTIACGPEEPEPAEVGPQTTDQLTVDTQALLEKEEQWTNELEAHFGKRLNAVWTGAFRPELGTDPRTVIAAKGITDAERAYVRAIPGANGHVQLVDAKYSAGDLKAFATRLRTVIPNWRLPAKYAPKRDERVESILHPPTTVPIPDSVWPKGLFRAFAPYPRQDGTELFGENIVSISVVECAPKLVAEAVRIADAKHVPLDAIRIGATQWDRVHSTR